MGRQIDIIRVKHRDASKNGEILRSLLILQDDLGSKTIVPCACRSPVRLCIAIRLERCRSRRCGIGEKPRLCNGRNRLLAMSGAHRAEKDGQSQLVEPR